MRLPGTFWQNQQLLFLPLHEEDDDNNPEWLYTLLNEEGRCCCDCHLPQLTLLLPTKEMTPLKKVYTSGHNRALITVTGLDYECFGELLQLFQPYFNAFTPWAINGCIKPRMCDTRGHKQIVDAATRLSIDRHLNKLPKGKNSSIVSKKDKTSMHVKWAGTSTGSSTGASHLLLLFQHTGCLVLTVVGA
jgi:hypothetical protein